MKSAILLHGTGGNNENYFWFADTKEYLESKGYEVWWPLLPNTRKPELAETRGFIEQNMPETGKETIIIGHSSACPVILNVMQRAKIGVKQVVLVGGFYKAFDDDDSSSLMLPESFDWDDIKNKVVETIFINSDNDPWGCNDQQAREAAIKLEATLVVATGQGHMGSDTHSQPYGEFPLLKRLLKA